MARHQAEQEEKNRRRQRELQISHLYSKEDHEEKKKGKEALERAKMSAVIGNFASGHEPCKVRSLRMKKIQKKQLDKLKLEVPVNNSIPATPAYPYHLVTCTVEWFQISGKENLRLMDSQLPYSELR